MIRHAAKLDAALTERLRAPVRIAVRVRPGLSVHRVVPMVESHGTVLHILPQIRVIAAVVPLASVPVIAGWESVESVEEDAEVRMFGDAQRGSGA